MFVPSCRHHTLIVCAYRPVDAACVVTTHGKDPSDAIGCHATTPERPKGNVMEDFYPARRCPPERPDGGKHTSPDDGTDRAWLLLGEPEPDPIRKRERESSSVSVSPTQLVSGERERRVEGGSKRSGALARHDTLPRPKRQRDSSHKTQRSWSASQEF